MRNMMPAGRYRADVLALAAFLLGVLIVFWQRVVHDDWLTEYDIFTYFLPWYGLLGDRLRDLDIPGWTPFFAGGSPVAGDPSGGWMYLFAMVPFSLLSADVAFKTMLLLQVLVGGVATYLLSRLIGLGPIAALMSTSAFAFGPFLFGQTSFATVAGQVSTWIPVALLAVELSLRASSWLSRAAWWGLAGVAISQMAVSWPGQGLINGLLIVGGWVAYRAVLSPPVDAVPLRTRLITAMTTGPAVLTLGLLLAAAGLLPRLAVNAQSSIPGGDYTGVQGGDYLEDPHTLFTLLRDTLADDPHYRPVGLSGTVVVLAVLAVLFARRTYAVPFFAGVIVVAGILSMGETPLHQVFYLLPGFETIHDHSPRRVLWVCSLAPAMLAGAAVEALPRWRDRRWTLPLLMAPLLLVTGVAIYLANHDIWIGWWPLGTAMVTTGLAVIAAKPRLGRWPHWPDGAVRGALAALILLAFVTPAARDLVGAVRGETRLADLPESCQTPSLMTTYLSRTDPGGAGAYLQHQAEGLPFRYASYAGRDPSTEDRSYSNRRCEPEVLAVLLNGRSTRLGLESIQGYNPMHLEFYVDYIHAMNGGTQDYHWVDPYPGALSSSPLLDMLNVRYILVAAQLPPEDDAVRAIAGEGAEVFRNDLVVVYENPDAFPRAWIVHEVRPNNDGEGLAALAGGQINGREIAFVDGPLPEVARPGAVAGQMSRRVDETVVVTDHGGDEKTAHITAQSPGLVVFSEIYEEGWRAWVDGEPVDILRTNHALRGVPVGAGEHTIEMRYEPMSLRIGLWTSGVTGIVMLGVAAAAIGWRMR